MIWNDIFPVSLIVCIQIWTLKNLVLRGYLLGIDKEDKGEL